MKRSNMIQGIAEDCIIGVELSNEEKFHLAKDILDYLESNGMLPPRTKLSLLEAYDNAWDDETIEKK